MKFGIFYELQLPKPWGPNSERDLYRNALSQLELADRLGYDYAWEVEHHFLEEYSHFPAPEGFLRAPRAAGGLPRRPQPADAAHPARPRHHPAHHQPSGPRRGAGGGARSAER